MFAHDRQRFVDMADMLGVASMTLMLQMKQYKMIKYCSMDNLIEQMKKKGGWGDEIQKHLAKVPN